MTLRQEVEVHEIHAESDYDEDDEGPVAPGSQDVSLSQLLISRNRKEPFENLPRPSSHHSVLQTPDEFLVLHDGTCSAPGVMKTTDPIEIPMTRM